MFLNRTYRAKDWELRRSGSVKHFSELGFMGYTAYFYLRNRKSGKAKLLKVGNCCWTYDSLPQLYRAVFKKTGIEIINDKTILA